MALGVGAKIHSTGFKMPKSGDGANKLSPNINNNTLASAFSSIYSFEGLANVETKEPLLRHLIPQGINIYVAQGGSGKTFLAYHILVEMLRRGAGCVCIDFDNPKDLPKSRGLLEVVEREGLKDNFVYLNVESYTRWREERKKGTYIEFLEYVFSLLPDGGEYFILIDSLQNFLPNVSDDTATFEFFKLLRKWSQGKNITFLILHHISKVARWTKGSTNIVNMSDVTYQLKSFKENGIIVSYTLAVEKARYLVPESLTIELKDDYQVEISEFAIDSETTKVVLRALVSYLRKNPRSKQSQIFEGLKEKFSRRQIEPVLKEYAEKGLFKTERGEKNAIFYEVNEESEYLHILFVKELPEVKKKLLCFVDSLMKDEISSFPDNISVNQFVFSTPEEVRKSVYRLTEREAEIVLSQLYELFPDDLPEDCYYEKADKKKLISEIEKMIARGLLFADDLPPLVWNSKEYKVLTDIEREVPAKVIREYVEELKMKFSFEDEDEENFDF